MGRGRQARRILAALACAFAAASAGCGSRGQESFDTPAQAGEALVSAAEKFDVRALKRILGPEGVDLVVTEDTVLDRNQATAFAAQARKRMEIEMDPEDPGRALLVVGPEAWPLPIPLVEEDGAWHYDTEAGREEILFRRIGRNELDAIEVCRGYVEAQQEYALEKHDGSTVNQYARRIISTPGKQDGLAWRGPDGSWQGPIGEEIAQAIAEGYSERSQPYHGYFYKILTGQGPSAPLGEMDFLVGGAMIGGFALVAAPADYGVTGVMSFMVSDDGVVYEKDLGPETLETFREMQRFDPDESWSPVEDS